MALTAEPQRMGFVKKSDPNKNPLGFFSLVSKKANKNSKKTKSKAELCVQVLCFTDMRRKFKRGEGVNYEIQYCQQVFLKHFSPDYTKTS